MTDLDRFVRMLRGAGIEPETRADFDGAPGAPIDVVRVTVPPRERRPAALDGYSGFYVEFWFDPMTGALVRVGLYE